MFFQAVHKTFSSAPQEIDEGEIKPTQISWGKNEKEEPETQKERERENAASHAEKSQRRLAARIAVGESARATARALARPRASSSPSTRAVRPGRSSGKQEGENRKELVLEVVTNGGGFSDVLGVNCFEAQVDLTSACLSWALWAFQSSLWRRSSSSNSSSSSNHLSIQCSRGSSSSSQCSRTFHTRRR